MSSLVAQTVQNLPAMQETRGGGGGGGLLRWNLLLQSMGSRACGLSSCGSRALNTGSLVVVHRLSCSKACGIFLDQEWDPVSLALAGGLYY